MPRRKVDREGLKKRVLEILSHGGIMAEVVREVGGTASTLYALRDELVKERAIRPIGRTRPQHYGTSLNITIYDFNGVPHWRHQGTERKMREGHSPSEPPSPPRPPRLPMLAGLEGDIPPPETVLLSNLQYVAEIVRWPDWDAKGVFYGWGENWKAENWDHGWKAKRTQFRLKVIRSPEFGTVVAQFANNKTVQLTFPREVLHAYRLRDKKEWFDDVVQGIFKHMAKTMGYGFGLIRQVSKEQWVIPLHGVAKFDGGPFELVLADGNKILIDQSEGWPELEVEGPQAPELTEGIMRVPDIGAKVDGQSERLDRLESVVRQQTEVIQRLTETLVKTQETIQAAFTPQVPKNGDERRGYA